MQFISIPDERYDEYRRSSDFIKEYIFPGGCLPSLGRLTSAMATSSRLWYAILYHYYFVYIYIYTHDLIVHSSCCSIEHVENIDMHYYQTLICWRNNLISNKE
jgi:cyclopropane-fatty-acyl-phospholipid synthase